MSGKVSPNSFIGTVKGFDKVSYNDQRKVFTFVSISIAAKYYERISMRLLDKKTFESIRFEEAVKCENILTPELLRMVEFEILKRLNFKVKDSVSNQNIDDKTRQYSRI